MFEREIYKELSRKQIRLKTISHPYIYLYLEEDNTSGYISYGGIMMHINPHKEVRMTEKDKLWFD